VQIVFIITGPVGLDGGHRLATVMI